MFPDTYSSAPELAGKVAIFTITVHSAQRETVHEANDEWAKEYTDIVLPNEDIDNIEDFKAYLKEYNYNQRLESAMMVYLSDITEVKSYNGKTLRLLKEMAESTLDNYATSGNTTIDEVAQGYGYSDAGEYEDIQAKAYLKAQMIYDKILEDKGISYTQEDLDEAFDKYLQEEGYEDYDIEAFREKAGEAWCWVYENCKFKRNLALDAVKDNVEIIEDTEVEEETSEEDIEGDDMIEEENSSTDSKAVPENTAANVFPLETTTKPSEPDTTVEEASAISEENTSSSSSNGVGIVTLK